MGLFDKFTKKAKPEKPTPKRKTKSEKELATEAGEPWVKVISFEVDPEDPGNGAFEIDTMTSSCRNSSEQAIKRNATNRKIVVLIVGSKIFAETY